jgi:hypothetical protein
MTPHHRQQLLGAVAIAAIVLLAGDRFVLTPLARAWKDRAARIADLQQQVAQGETLLQRQDTIRTRWEHMRTNTLPQELSVAEDQVLKAFDRWGRESGANIAAIRPQWKSNDEDSLVLECRADAAGNLAALVRFLYEIEKDPLAIIVDALEITARDPDGQQISLALQLSGLLLNLQPSQ